MQTTIDGINYQPWISEAYYANTGIYGRLLIIGESHYVEDEEDDEIEKVVAYNKEEIIPNNFTTAIVKGYINKTWDINFLRNLGLLFNKENRYEVWENVAFANAIQVGLESSVAQPTAEHIATIIPAFWKLLESLKPEKVLICSKRMWNHWLPDNDARCQKIGDIESNGKHSTIWQYSYSGGSCQAIGINHPSSYFSYPNWAPLVREFIAM